MCVGVGQPHCPGWARVSFSSFFLKFLSIIFIFPQIFLIFVLILALRVGDSPTREVPGYATVDKRKDEGTFINIYNFCKKTQTFEHLKTTTQKA